jgi:hypothetical protein
MRTAEEVMRRAYPERHRVAPLVLTALSLTLVGRTESRS